MINRRTLLLGALGLPILGLARSTLARLPGSQDLPLHGNTLRLMELTAGKWIVEAGELKGMSQSDVAALKATFSRVRSYDA